MYTYTVTDCVLPSTEVRTLTAYLPNGESERASPATLTYSGELGVSTVSFVFKSLLVDELTPGEELELVISHFSAEAGLIAVGISGWGLHNATANVF